MPQTLTGRRVTLRSPRSSDVDERLALGRHPEIVRMLGGSATKITPMTREHAAAYLDRLTAHPCAWVIEHDGRFLGSLRLDGVDAADGTASLATALYDITLLGQGLGTEAVQLALAYAFDTFALHRLTVRVLTINTRAIRCYARCGFVTERRERDAVVMDGKAHDDLIMALREPDYRAVLAGHDTVPSAYPDP